MKDRNAIESSPRLLKLDEAADHLAISRRKLEQLVADSQIPKVKIGKATRFRMSDLAAFVEANLRSGQ